MSNLLLWLEAPLQSWGADSRYGNRDTLPFPTRSGVLGLLCCAAGRGGAQEEWLQRMAGHGQTVAAYARQGKSGPVRPPLLRDFHMVGSGYDTSDPWQNLLVPKTVEGKKPVGSGSKMTFRNYLQDMAFACALDLPEDEATVLAEALQQPVWELSLGRKNCPPADVVGRGVFADEEAALKAAEAIAAAKQRVRVFTVREGALDSGEVLTLNDVPVCFGLRKVYRDRQVTMEVVTNGAD